MMTVKTRDSSVARGARRPTQEEDVAGKQMITPAERWLLISEKAYYRVQKRGFIGGDPLEDWVEAEKEVDSRYETELSSVFSGDEAQMLSDQVKTILGGYGLGHLGLDTILEKHREGLEKLTKHNRQLIDSTSRLASSQTALFQEAVTDAMKNMQSFSQGKVSPEGFAKQAELSARAIENVLVYFRSLADAMTENVSPGERKGQGPQR